MIKFAHGSVSLAIMALVTMVGCVPEVPATNPFDPATPAESQERARIQGLAYVEAQQAHPRITQARALIDDDGPLTKIKVIVKGPTDPGDIFTDENGRFEIPNLVPGSYDLDFVLAIDATGNETGGSGGEIAVSGIGSQYESFRLPARQIAAGQTLDLENDFGAVVLKARTESNAPAFSLKGVARLAAQATVGEAQADHSGIRVEVRLEENEAPTGFSTTTDKNGAFGFAINPGRYKLFLSARDHKPTSTDAITVTGEGVKALDAPIVLEINPGGISGLVRLEDAVEGGNGDVTVSLVGTEKAPVTGDDGTFSIGGVGAGIHRLRVSKMGYDTREVAGIVVSAGIVTELPDAIALQRSRGTVKGQITLAGATTSDGVAVQLNSADSSNSFTTLTNSDGEYRFERIPVGTYTVQTCKQGYLPPDVRLGHELVPDEVKTLDGATMNRPVIQLTPQDGMGNGRYFTNQEAFKLRFDELPIEQLTGVKITGDAQVANGDVDEQGWIDGQITTDDTGAYLELTLSPNDGPKLVEIQFRNDGCFISETYQMVITLDRTGPSLVSAQFAQGPFTNEFDATLNLIAIDAHRLTIRGDVQEVENQVVEGGAIEIDAKQTIAVRLAEGDGLKRVEVQAIDAAGNVAVAPASIAAEIFLDTQAPRNPTITIENGLTSVDETRVVLAVSADDENGIADMLISNDPLFMGAEWQPYRRDLNWTLEDNAQGDVALYAANDGMKTVYARFRDEAGNEIDVQNAAKDQIELDRLGSITVEIHLDGPATVPVTGASILRGNEARADKITTSLGNPDADGRLVVDNIPVGVHYLSATLENFYIERFAEVVVGPKSSNPEIVRMELKFETGTLTGQIKLAEADACPPDIEVYATNVDAGTPENAEPVFQPDCTFTAELNVGTYTIEMRRQGFEPVVVDNVAIKSFRTYDLGGRTLPRSRGSIEGIFNLQGRFEHDGINVTFAKKQDILLGETTPTYTTLTVENGRFSREGLWAGTYVVTADKDGFIRKTLTNEVVVEGGRSANATLQAVSPDANQNDLVILERQTGDFGINGGAEYTNERTVTVNLKFTGIEEFQYRVNGAEFSDWIKWEPDEEGQMDYSVELPGITGANDLGSRLIEIRTRNLQGAESSEPFSQASIILDQTPPSDPFILINGGDRYTNSRNVSLRLSANDLNRVTRIRISRQDDCAQGCVDDDHPFCNSVAYSAEYEQQLFTDLDGEETLYVCFIDPAGNVSPSASASIILDREAPAFTTYSVLDVDGNACSENCRVNGAGLVFSFAEKVDGFTQTDSKANAIWLSLDDPDYQRGDWQPFQTGNNNNQGSLRYNLVEPDGSYSFFFRAKDEAGNVRSHTMDDPFVITVDLDTNPPALPITDATEYFTRQPSVNVTFANRTDDVTQIQWSWDQTWTDVEPVAPTDTVSIPLPAADGQQAPLQKLHTLYVRYWDDHRNPGPAKPIFVTYDTDAPTINRAVINYGNPYLDQPTNIPFEVICTDLVAPANRLKMGITQLHNGATYEVRPSDLYAPLVTGNIAATDGVSQATVLCTDQAGNVSEPFTIDFTLDTKDPVAGPNHSWIQINDGADYTETGTVSLAIQAVDNQGGSGISLIALANGNLDCATAQYIPFVPQTDHPNRMNYTGWTLPSGDIEHQVSACVQDRAGRTQTIADTITLDTLPPEGTVTIVGARTFGEQQFVGDADLVQNVSLRVGLGIGLADANADIYVAVAIGDLDCRNANYTDYRPNLVVSLPIGAPGAKTVSVCFKDGAGNTTEYTSRVVYDSATPIIVGDPLINFGQSDLNDPNDVALDVTCTDSDTATTNLALTVGTANDVILYQGAYAPRVVVNVPADEPGGRTINVQCTDPANNSSVVKTSDYVLDTEAPLTGHADSNMVINASASATRHRSVQVAINAVDNLGGSGVSEMAIGHGVIDCGTAQYGPLQAEVSWVLTEGDGAKNVSICLKDRAGNVAQISDSILLDTLAPTGDLHLAGQPMTPSTILSAVVQRDSLDTTQFALAAGFLDCDAQATNYVDYTDEPQTIDVNGEGLFSLTLCLRDAAGNTSTYEETITVDSTAPSGFITVNDGAVFTTTKQVMVNVTASSDVVDVKVANAGLNCADNAGYQPLVLAIVHDLSDGDGPKQVSACLRDGAGNTYEVQQQSITVDSTPPKAGRTIGGQLAQAGILIENGTALTNVSVATVTLIAEDAKDNQGSDYAGSGIDAYKVSTGETCAGGLWQAWPGGGVDEIEIPMAIEAGDNVQRAFSVMFRDRAGNEVADCTFDRVTIDTNPLSLSAFRLEGTDGDPSVTTQRAVIAELNHSGSGTCAQFQVSMSPSFAPELTIDLPCVATAPDHRKVPISEEQADGILTFYARVWDTAGNASVPLPMQIELDTENPTLSGISMATSSQGPYVNERGVEITLEDASGGASIRYKTIDSITSCPDDDEIDELTEQTEFAERFYVSFDSDGNKTICVAVVDKAGNASRIARALLAVDTKAPNAPNLNPSNLSGVNSSCVKITPSGHDLDLYFWKFQYRTAGATWVDSLTDEGTPTQVGAPISIPLYQDSDNIIEIRAVDLAGNTGEIAQAIIEENSTVLVPTGLEIKQICDGGKYAILKDLSVGVTMYVDGLSAQNSIDVRLAKIPSVALLDLETYEVKSLNPPISANTITDASCNAEALYQMVLDAACSAEAGQSKLLVVSPSESQGSCPFVLNGPPLENALIRNKLWVYPDPIDSPLKVGEVLTENMLLDPSGAEDSEGLAIVSIDALRWYSDYDFTAIATTAETSIAALPIIGLNNNRFAHRIRRIGRVNGAMEVFSVRDSVVVTIPTNYTTANILSSDAHMNRLRGLALSSDRIAYLKTGSTHWELRVDEHDPSRNQAVETWFDNADDLSVSPYNVIAGPALLKHTWPATTDLSRLFTFLNQSGAPVNNRAGDDFFGWGAGRSLGSGMPDFTTANYAPYFEVKAGDEAEINWVDPTDLRSIHMDDEYNTTDKQRYRFPVDIEKGVFPYLLGGGDGEPYVIYHTKGLTQGIVIGLKNEATCAE